MAIGDIQLSPGATQADLPDETGDAKARAGVVIGEQPTDPDGHDTAPAELENTALDEKTVYLYLQELTQQPAWRREADRAVEYYDGNQLSQETVERLQARGQPPLITNIIKPTIDTVLGMEAKTRSDWRVRADDAGECSDDVAEALSVKLKHAETESRADRAVSDAYAAQIKAGLGWVEVARDHDPFKCPYRVRAIHRREIWWDWRSEQPDISDARYLIRRRWCELDHAIALMPQYAGLFRQTSGGWAGFDPMMEKDTGLIQSWELERDSKINAQDWRDVLTQRVCLYEIWYRKWVRGHVMRLPNGTTIEVDFNNPRHCEAIVSRIATVREGTFQRVRLAWYVGPHFLYDVPSPYAHGHFPYVPFFGYREDLTGAPYGMIRGMISPQDEINARKAKMLWSLNSRRVIADSDSVADHTLAADEVARPDAYIVLNANRKPNSQFRVEPGGELAMQQFQVMQEAKQEIAEASGIHKAMQGQSSSATSGLAINSLIEQGLSTLAEINDNYRYSRRLVGEMLFGLMTQSMLKGPCNVVIGEGKNKKVIQLNTPGPDPETGEPTIINDLSAIKATIVLDDVPSTPTYRMQQLQMLTEVTKSLPPQLQGAIVDFVIEATDLPKKHEMADRLRMAAGIKDPSQQEQAAQAQQAMQQQQMQMAQQEQQAKIAGMQAQAQKTAAEAQQLAQPTAQASDQTKPLLDQIAQLQQQLADRSGEIQAKYAGELNRAHIDAQSRVEAERIKAAGPQALQPLFDRFTQMQHQMDMERQKDAQALAALAKELASVRKLAESPT